MNEALMVAELFILLCAALMDCDSGEIPLPYFPCFTCLMAFTRWHSHVGFSVKEIIISACITTGLYFFLFLFGNLGGADMLACPGICIALGYYSLYATMLASIITIPLLIYMRKKEEHPYPFLPFMAAGYAIVMFSVLTASV